MMESDLIYMDHCIVCKQLIEDVDPTDLQISRGAPTTPSTEEHFSSKSYYRCSNVQCLSCFFFFPFCYLVYHKACVHGCNVSGRCGVCRIEPPAPRKQVVIEETFLRKKEEDSRLRRREARHESDDERHTNRRYHPRSTRGPTYHEEDSDDEPQVKKRRVQPARTRSQSSAMKFERIDSEQAMEALRELVRTIYGGVLGDVDPMQCVWSATRSVIAVGIKIALFLKWWSKLDEPVQRSCAHVLELLQQHQ